MSVTVILHNPNRIPRDTLYDTSRLFIEWPEGHEPPREMGFTHPVNRYIREMYRLQDAVTVGDRTEYYYRFFTARRARRA